MYHQHYASSHGHHHHRQSQPMTDREPFDYSAQRSPNAVTAAPSPSSSISPRIKILNQQRHENHPHELEIQEFEAEADYKEYMLYQRIMQHRNSRAGSSSDAFGSNTEASLSDMVLIPPPALPWKMIPVDDHHQARESSFLNTVMIQRLRDNAFDRNNSFNFHHGHQYNGDDEQQDGQYDIYDINDHTNYNDEEEELESEEGIFDLDM